MRKTDSALGIHPLRGLRSLQVDLSKQNLFSRSFPKHRFE